MKTYLKVSCILLATGLLAACESMTKPTAQPAGQAAAQSQAQNIRNWAGTWSGTWSTDCAATMMISDVSPSGAVVVHEYGECGDLRAGKASDADATIADGKLNTRYLFADIEYVQLDKDSLQGTISRDGTAIGSGVFTRVQ